MNFTITPLSQLDETSLARLAKLHCDVMPTLLAELGRALVLRYYQVAQTDPTVIGICAVAPNGDVLGWAMGSPNPTVLNARLRQPLAWFILQILRKSLTHPGILLDLSRTVLSPSPANAILAGQVELTYIGVASTMQGNGIGRTLLETFVNAARSNGYRQAVLSVETENQGAIALYTNLAFESRKHLRKGDLCAIAWNTK
jgi:ribosomal protein S18 acetylase RimI-like enzyme